MRYMRGEPFNVLALSGDLRADTMRPLFRYADECAQAGRLWTTFGRTNDDGRLIRSTAETPCPADDPLIRYFASR